MNKSNIGNYCIESDFPMKVSGNTVEIQFDRSLMFHFDPNEMYVALPFAKLGTMRGFSNESLVGYSSVCNGVSVSSIDGRTILVKRA